MLVSNALLIASDTLNSKDTVFLAQEACVQLTVRNDPKENSSNTDSQASSNQENDLPGLNGGSMDSRSLSNTVCYQTTEYLGKSIE